MRDLHSSHAASSSFVVVCVPCLQDHYTQGRLHYLEYAPLINRRAHLLKARSGPFFFLFLFFGSLFVFVGFFLAPLAFFSCLITAFLHRFLRSTPPARDRVFVGVFRGDGGNAAKDLTILNNQFKYAVSAPIALVVGAVMASTHPCVGYSLRDLT